MRWALFLLETLATDALRCVDCKYFKKPFLQDPKFGTCSFFPKKVDDGYGFVTGKSESRIEYEYCVVARQFETLCGSKGNYYQKR